MLVGEVKDADEAIKMSPSDSGREGKTVENQEGSSRTAVSATQKIRDFIQKPFFVCVILPSLFFAVYQMFWASERYESQAKVIVQQPDGASTLDASLALLSGLGGAATGGNDPQLLEAYILSNDMLSYLNKTLNLKEYYAEDSADIFSRLPSDATREDLLEYYQNHISVEVDDVSGVISIAAQGFDSGFAQTLARHIVSRSEWYINNIGHQLADAQLSFVKIEHELNEDKFRDAQITLLAFQQKYNLLDPTAEGIAMQQIAYGIEGQIASKEAELKGLTNIMSEHAPQVKATQNELEALRRQLQNERNKLSADSGEVIPVSEILAKYADLKVAMELALQAYTSSKISLESSRIEAYRQLKYLITVQAATEPEKSTYPDALYNVSLFLVLSAMLFAIIRIILAVVYELK
ncbi:hypothetical protein [Marinomonas sp. GJ51-6]|uniref:hypothetical protein n=1 Tax=Marinomonas sp. GJ51-6 TaxID=2992802 RepID=UPI002934BDC8|nr:hypothetical protein [Marinomonas sp. GJ51-6]WOD06150.1 hypothetical protein ONZ50_10400 [Marinomonas sp. GJ51-6]